MIPVGHRLWRLSKAGDDSLGLCCTEYGLFLGRTPLVEQRNGAYIVRSQGDLERLLGRGYGADIMLDRVMPGLAVVASALGAKNLCLAQIASVQLRLPDLPDLTARLCMETEDLLIKGERPGARFVRAGWDEVQHPRTGTPPNPGWFAPKDSSAEWLQLPQVAQRGRGGREPEEILDPVAPVRQAVWEARIALLRRIDPDNPNLTYFANPSSAPNQAALNRLDAEIASASIHRVTEKLMPGGVPIGKAGKGIDVRELPGGLGAARNLFDYLRPAGTVHRSDANATVIKLPGNAGFITFRPVSRSGPPAIDVNVPGITFDKIHFP